MPNMPIASDSCSCAASCEATVGCVGWTYVRNEFGLTSACWLRSNWGAAVDNCENCWSGELAGALSSVQILSDGDCVGASWMTDTDALDRRDCAYSPPRWEQRWSTHWMVHHSVVELRHKQGEYTAPISVVWSQHPPFSWTKCVEVGPLTAQIDLDRVGSNKTFFRALLRECNGSPEQQWTAQSQSQGPDGWTGYDGYFSFCNPSSQLCLANMAQCPYGGVCAVEPSWHSSMGPNPSAWFYVEVDEEQPIAV